MVLIAPSILSADFSRLAEAVKLADKSGADLIHVDIMDGHFVPNLTLGPQLVAAIRRETSLPIDVHLMVENPRAFVPLFHEAGADWISIHVEATAHLHKDLAMIRGLFPVAIRAGQKAGHDPTEIGRWRELLEKLTPFRLADLTEPETERRGSELVHRKGVGDGKKVESLKVFAVGKNAKGEWIRNRFAHLADKMAYYGVPDPELAAVFPSNVIGLSQRGTELFKAAVTEVRMHPPADHDLDISRPASMEGRAMMRAG